MYPKKDADSPRINVLLSYSLLSSIFNISPHTGLERLKAILLESGHYCEIYDPNVDKDPDAILKRVKAGEFQIVGFSVAHSGVPNLDWQHKLMKASKNSDKRCIFVGGGEQATFNDEFWLEFGIDLLFIGFAEKMLVEFCHRLSLDPNGEICSLVEGINGVSYMNESGEKISKLRDPLTRDEFQYLSYDLILKSDTDYHKYWNHNRQRISDLRVSEKMRNSFVIEYTQLYTNSHCAWDCGFCSTSQYLRKTQADNLQVLMISAEQLYELVEVYASKYGTKLFSFCEDDFVIGNRVGKQRVMDFCEMVIEGKKDGRLDPDVGFYCQNRIDNFLERKKTSERAKIKERVVNYELLSKMGEAGWRCMSFGVETLSDKLLNCKSINKRVTSKECRAVLDAAIKLVPAPQLNLILGIPESTPEDLVYDMNAGVEYLQKGYAVQTALILGAYPGSPIYYDEKNYPRTYKKYKTPFGKTLEISDDIPPFDPLVRHACMTAKETIDSEIEKLRKFTPWKKGYFPRMMFTIINFMVVARELGRSDLEQRYMEVFQELVPKKSGSDPYRI
ncbi:MAG: hypothetical protein CBB75_12325 [bacterium TMED15]|nr:MAG: hypothetical protein CBB75_12325 [bacterium TMED15]